MTGIEQERFAHEVEAKNSTAKKRANITALNDRFRRTGVGGKIYVTAGIEGLGVEAALEIHQKIAMYNSLSEDNDPYSEHDFGSIDYRNCKIFWKIDYYDKTMECGSPDPSDTALTTRVMTIMLAAEY